MQLRVARLCLDCEEIHDGPQCPACASETFAFLNRWVPTSERRTKIRTAAPSPSASRGAQRMLVGVGVCGGAAYLLNRWLNRARKTIEAVTDTKPTGELR
jgi:hypothetical protein